MSSTDEKFREIAIGDEIVFIDEYGQEQRGRAEGWNKDSKGRLLYIGTRPQHRVRLHRVLSRLRTGCDPLIWSS